MQYGVRAQTALPYAMNSEFSRVMATQMVILKHFPLFPIKQLWSILWTGKQSKNPTFLLKNKTIVLKVVDLLLVMVQPSLVITRRQLGFSSSGSTSLDPVMHWNLGRSLFHLPVRKSCNQYSNIQYFNIYSIYSFSKIAVHKIWNITKWSRTNCH